MCIRDRGYIGNCSANGYIQLQSESTSLGYSINGTLNLNSSTQLLSRINLTGQEFYQAANTSTDGIALLLGVNRTGNRQLWIGDTSKLTQNATNSCIRITSEGYIDCIATNGTTPLPIFINGSAIWLSAPTQCSSSLGITGTLTANTIVSTGLTTSLNAKQDLLTSSTLSLIHISEPTRPY